MNGAAALGWQNLFGSQAVGSFAIVIARREIDAQAHLLLERAADEAAHRMSLPSGRLSQFLERCSLGPLQQRQNLGGLRALAGRGRLLALMTGCLAGAGALGLGGTFARAWLAAACCFPFG